MSLGRISYTIARVTARISPACARLDRLSAHTLSTSDLSDSTFPSSLRSKLEADCAREGDWENEFNDSPLSKSYPHPPTRSSIRDSAKSLAHRLVKAVDCQLEPGTPRYVSSAMAPSTQCRVVMDAHPPHRITHVSPAWTALTGLDKEEVLLKPGLAVLLAPQTSGTDVPSILESLHLAQRGCATVVCRAKEEKGGFPARVTVSPLMNEYGDTSHMLCTVRPL